MIKELLIEFPQLKEKRSKLFYKMIFYKTFSELKEAVKKLEKNQEPLPILLFFYKKKEVAE